MKHEKIVNASNALEEALQTLDRMIKVFEGTDIPEEENVKRGSNIPLIDFLNSQADILDNYVKVIYGMRDRLEACFFDNDNKIQAKSF